MQKNRGKKQESVNPIISEPQPKVKITDATNPTQTVKEPTKPPPATNYTIDTTKKEMPKREDFADNWAFIEAKNEWKRLNNQ